MYVTLANDGPFCDSHTKMLIQLLIDKLGIWIQGESSEQIGDKAKECEEKEVLL